MTDAVDSTLHDADATIRPQQLVTDLLDCNRKDYTQVKRMLYRIHTTVKRVLDVCMSRYLIEDLHIPLSVSPNASAPDTVAQNTPDDEDANDVDAFDNGLEMLRKRCTPWLVSVLNRPPVPITNDDDDNDNDEDDIVELVTNIMSMLCGRTATGECTTTWHLQNTGVYRITETTYTEAEIGFQTWGGGIMLSKMIDQGVINVRGHTVLELGCGTGLAGMVCGRSGSDLTVMTDYHPTVLNNVQRNLETNNMDPSIVLVRKLDWIWCMGNDGGVTYAYGGDRVPDHVIPKPGDCDTMDPILRSTEFSMIIAADCVFDTTHSFLVPKVAKMFISKRSELDPRFHVILPHRERFKVEIAAFEKNMDSEGWILEHSVWIEKDTINFRYYVYRL